MRAGSGWQYLLADISLILFMVTAAALARAQEGQTEPPAISDHLGGHVSPQGQSLAIYRPGPDVPPLGQWLREQSPDARQQLTIIAQYHPGDQPTALHQAQALVKQAGEAGRTARIIIEPGTAGSAATLAFDLPSAGNIHQSLSNGGP